METLRKPRRLWQQERGRTKGSMNASVAQHVRFLAVLYKTTNFKTPNLRGLRKGAVHVSI